MFGGERILRDGRGVDGTGGAGATGMIRVAAGGHRDDGLNGADMALLVQRIAETLDTISRLSHGSPALVVSLAEGADRLIVAEALERKWPVTAVLPFERDEFARDFESGASRREYRQFVARADHVIELPAVRSEAGDGAAYAAANQVMLDRADLVLTVWDGKPARGPGGTAEVIAQAWARGLPVVWIAAQPPHGIRLLDPEGARKPAPWWGRLASELARPDAHPSAE
jgi:hypothetical protein